MGPLFAAALAAAARTRDHRGAVTPLSRNLTCCAYGGLWGPPRPDLRAISTLLRLPRAAACIRARGVF